MFFLRPVAADRAEKWKKTKFIGKSDRVEYQSESESDRLEYQTRPE